VIGSTPPTPPPGAAPTESEVIARLTGLGPADYDRARTEVAKSLGIQLKTLDDMVKAARVPDRNVGRRPVVEHEPADQPVDPAALLDEVAATIQHFVVLDPEQAHAAALWVPVTAPDCAGRRPGTGRKEDSQGWCRAHPTTAPNGKTLGRRGACRAVATRNSRPLLGVRHVCSHPPGTHGSSSLPASPASDSLR
jgi:hypothetical protein